MVFNIVWEQISYRIDKVSSDHDTTYLVKGEGRTWLMFSLLRIPNNKYSWRWCAVALQVINISLNFYYEGE